MKKTVHITNLFALSFGIAVFTLLSSPPASAETLTWDGANNGLWNTDTNWDPDQTPTTADALSILGPNNTEGALTSDISAAAAGGSINFTNTSATNLSNTLSGANQTLTLGSALVNGVMTGTGAVTIGSALTNQNVNVALGANQTWTVGSGGLQIVNVISGGGFFITKEGAGSLALGPTGTGAGPTNTFSGGFILNNGIVDLYGNSVLGAGGLTINGGTLNARGISRTLNNSVTAGGDFTLNGASAGLNTLTLSGTVNLGGATRTITVDAGGATTLTGVISNGGLIKSGTGRLNISNTGNTYSGPVTIQNGTLRAVQNGALGTGTSEIALGDATSISSNFSPTLMVNGVSATISRNVTVGASNAATTGTYTINTDNGGSAWGISGNIMLNQNLTVSNGSTGTATFSGNITSGSTGTQILTLNFATGRTIAITGTIGGGTGSVALTKAGTGLLSLTTAHTYTGDTRIAAGTLQLDTGGTNLSLQNSTVDMNAADTGVLQFRGSTGTVGAVFGGLKGSRNISLQNTSGNAVALTIGGNNQSTTYSGVLSGSGSLSKTGTGTFILSNTNIYGGTTTVTGGELLVTGSTASPVIVQAGAAIGGSGTINGNLTLGSDADFVFDLSFVDANALAVSGTFSLDSSFGIANLVAADGSALDWSDIGDGSYTLLDTSFVFNETNISNFGAANAFDIGGGRSAFFSNGSLVLNVVPEPGTFAMLLGGMGVLIVRRRR